MIRIRGVVFGLAGAVALLGLAPRQSTPPAPAPQQPIFRAGADVVELDVSVFDKDRHPVKGLKAEDFTILQDGKPQPVVAFAPVDLPDPIPMTAKWMADSPADVDTNEVNDRRLVVIVLDDALVAFDDGLDLAKVKATRDAADRVIESLGPADLAAVVFTYDNLKGQGLTSDRARLHEAAARFAAGPSAIRARPTRAPAGPQPPGPSEFCSPYWNATSALRAVVDALGAVPHRRKLVINISVGLNLDVFGSRDDKNVCTGRARDEVSATLEAAQAANVNVYGVDPSGLKVVSGVLDREVTFLQTMAEHTGGRVIINTNAITAEMPGILAENASYYLLGYSAPPNEKTRESLKRVEVKVNRPNVDVRSRSLYAAPAAAGSKAAPAPPASESAIADIVPKTDLPLRVTAAPIRAEDGTSAIALVVGVRQPASVEASRDQIDLIVDAFTVDGRNRATAKQSAHVSVRPTDAVATTGGEARSEVLARMSLTPGRYSLRLAVHSGAAGVEGSVDTDVVVPDFKKDALSLSGVALSASPGPRAAPADAFAGLIPLLPTAERTFDRASQVSAFVRAYQGGASPAQPVSLHIRVLGDRDAIAMDRTETLPADAFAQDRSAGETMKLRVADWPPGPYLLRIDATSGKHTATREVRFDVR